MDGRFWAVHAAFFVALATGCADSPAPSTELTGDTTGEQVDSVAGADEDSAATIVLGDLRGSAATGAESEFAHDPHREIACRACHAAVTGHDGHAEVECEACHGTPEALVGETIPTAGECLACHHDTARVEPCSQCHGPAAGLPTAPVTLNVDLAAAGLSRDITPDFQHEVHLGFECESCHGEPPTRERARDCTACHSEHHEPTRQCVSCHATLPLNTHTADAHVGCGGSGCHDDAEVVGIPLSRQVCIACHQDQTEHEPGRECGPCHRIDEGFGTVSDSADDS